MKLSMHEIQFNGQIKKATAFSRFMIGTYTEGMGIIQLLLMTSGSQY